MIIFRLGAILAARGWTAYRLAQELGITMQRAYRLAPKKPENRITRLPVETLDVLCRVLGVQPGELLTYVPDKPAPPATEKRAAKRTKKGRARADE